MKVTRVMIPDHNGCLHHATYKKHRSVNMTSDVGLSYLLHRIGVATELYDMMVYDNHFELVKVIVEPFTTDPPPGYKRATLGQVHRAYQK